MFATRGACRVPADGVDIRISQLMLGHTSIQQTQRYLHVTDETGSHVSARHANQQIVIGSGKHDGPGANERAVLADRQELHFAVGDELSEVRRGAC